MEWGAARVRALRTAMRLTREEFAEQVGVSSRTVATWEAADTPMHPRNARALDGFHLRLSAQARERYDAALASPAGTLTSALAGHDPAEGLERRRVSPMTVEALRGLVLVLRRLDDEIGPAQLVDVVTVNLDWVARLVARADSSGPEHRGLCAVVGELAQLAGWLRFDLDQPDKAVRHLALAQGAAQTAGDGPLTAYTLAWRSVVVGQTDPGAGLVLAEMAQRQAGQGSSAFVAAWLARVHAEALAATGDSRGMERALERVDDAAGRPRGGDDPPWTYFIDDGQLHAYRGVCYVAARGWTPGARRARTGAGTAASRLRP